MLNSVILIGRLTHDPELKYTPSGVAVCNFTLAVDRGLNKQKKEEAESKGYPTADFINIVVFNKQAENCASYLKKGSLAAVQGSIQTRNYNTKNGSKRYVTEIVANRVQFLEWNNNNQNTTDNYDPDDYAENSEDENVPF